MISAGKMPTLAAGNCAKPPLTQIQPNPAPTLADTEESKLVDPSKPGANSWPA